MRLTILTALIAALAVVVFWPVTPKTDHPYFKSAPLHRTEIIAHGGGQGVQPPNTNAALDTSAKMGADILEVDVQRTKDGVLILLHDDTLDRTTDMTGAVASMTWEEVSRARADTVIDDPETQDIPVPRVDEALARHPEKRWLIEIKPGPERLQAATELCAEIRRQNMTNLIMVAAFDHQTLKTFRTACPSVATSMSATEVRNFVIAARLGLSRFVTTPALAMQIPREQSGLNLVHPRIINAAHTRNIRIHVWTINDRIEMEELMTLGVDGIITDYVATLKQVLGITS